MIIYSEMAKQAIAKAKEFSAGEGFIRTSHLLAAIAFIPDNIAKKVLNNNSVYYENIKKKIDANINESEGGDSIRTKSFEKVLANGCEFLAAFENDSLTTAHLLLGIIKESGCEGAIILSSCHDNLLKIADELSLILNFNLSQNSDDGGKKYLQKYTRNLSKQNENNNLAGRDFEIERILNILRRKTKSNPCLIGEPGVGKTAIVESLAYKIKSDDELRAFKILSLNTAALLAGTKYRGDFEERINGIISDLKSSKNTILFVDEIHNLRGAGGAEGAIDAANLLKEVLSRNEIKVIGATTIAEYKKIEQDPAFERRFQPVYVEEPTISDAYIMLKNIKEQFEQHHKIAIDDELLWSVVKLSKMYIYARFLPDVAIDLLDEAAATSKQRGGGSLLEEDILRALSSMSKVPIDKIRTGNIKDYKQIKERIKSKLIGQDAAVDAVVDSMMINSAAIKDKNRPLAVFFFQGSSGTGKTYLASLLAEELFFENSLIRLDMSNYSEAHSTSALIGSPPGYVGYGEGGKLTDAVKNKPFSIVLFDEIEKANNSIYNLLLQIMDYGQTADSTGRVVSFRNTILIFTSNINSKNARRSLGFLEDNEPTATEALTDYFSFEFLNRIDKIVPFNELSVENLERIVCNSFDELKERLRNREIDLLYTSEEIEHIANKIYDNRFGARAVDRYFKDEIETKIANTLLSRDDVSTIEIRYKDESIVTVIKYKG